MMFIASDHAGFLLKQFLWCSFSNDFEIVDLGTSSFDSCDYPIFAQNLSKKILETDGEIGILVCATGIGMSIAANRFVGIRAALCMNEKMAVMARKHNDANVIVFGSNYVSPIIAEKCVNLFINTDFEGERHSMRLKLIDGDEK